MILLRLALCLILAIKLYPFTEDANRTIAAAIQALPASISQVVWDALSTPTWLYGVALALVMLNPFLYVLRYGKLRGNHLDKVKSVDDLRELNWEQYEEFTAELYRRLGFRAVVLGGSGGDNGIDVIAKKGRKKIIVQCKHWKENVKVEIVREMFGVMYDQKASEVHVITTTGFTPKAIEFAEGKKRLKLIGPEDTMGLIRKGKNYYKTL